MVKTIRNFKTRYHGENAIKVTFIVDDDKGGPRGRICFIPLTEFTKSFTKTNKTANRKVVLDWINANKTKCYPMVYQIDTLCAENADDTAELTNW